MLPQPPPRLLSLACTERLGLMVQTADELAIELGLGGSRVAEYMVAELLGGLRFLVSELAHERAQGRTTSRLMLESLADKLETAAARRGPVPNETQLRALIARMRLLSRN